MKAVKSEDDLKYIRFKLEPTYSCYICEWEGSDEEVGMEKKVDHKDRDYNRLYCPKCGNQLLHTEYQKVYYG